VEFNFYKLLLLFLFPSLTFPPQTLNPLAALQFLFSQHSYPPICYILPAPVKQTVHICCPFPMWRDIALNYGMTFNAHQSGPTVPQHAASCL